MSESNALYRVQFICHSERYEVYVREVNQGQLFGFIEIAHFVWDNHTALIVDPSHEKLKSEFADVTRTLIPMHHVLRVDQVRKQGPPASPNWATTSPLSQAPSIPRSPESCRQASLWGVQLPGQLQDALTEPAQGGIFPRGHTTPGCGSRRRNRRGRGGSPAPGYKPG